MARTAQGVRQAGPGKDILGEAFDGLAIYHLGFVVAMGRLEHLRQAGPGKDILGEAFDGLAIYHLGFVVAMGRLEHIRQAVPGNDILGETLPGYPRETESERNIPLPEESILNCCPCERIVGFPPPSFFSPTL